MILYSIWGLEPLREVGKLGTGIWHGMALGWQASMIPHGVYEYLERKTSHLYHHHIAIDVKHKVSVVRF